jgi:hypothetical protein
MSYNVQSLVTLLANPPQCPDAYQGRGIVICGGGSYLPSTYIAIQSLRSSGCKLPIQLWYLGTKELPPVLAQYFHALEVETVDALPFASQQGIANLTGWQAKPLSIVYSPFREVLSLDADNFALRNPEFLFDSNEFQVHGCMFWPDFYFEQQCAWTIKPAAWSLLGLEPRLGAELETGQLLIDKKRQWRSLMGAFHMNVHAEFYYQHCTYGDKDTYALTWALTNDPYYVIPHRPKLLEEMIRIQYAPDGSDLFQHSRKWVLPSQKNLTLPSYQRESDGMMWLREFEEIIRALH